MNDRLKMKIYYGKEPETQKEKLKLQVQEKVVSEYNKYIDSLRAENIDEIISSSYEKVCKEEFTYLFDTRDLSVTECKALLKSPNILDECYDEWISSDGNFHEMLEYSTDKAIRQIIDDYRSDLKAKSRYSR